jgi:hypothetical protein
VEFLLDGYRIEETTVAPYSARWTIVMSDTVPTEATVITQTETVTSPEGIVSEQVVTLTEVIIVPDPLEPTEPLQYVQVYSGGLTIISDTTTITPILGYTETHVLKFIAYDAAGNETESEITIFHVVHDPETLEEEQPEAILLPIHPRLHSGRMKGEPIAWLSPVESPVMKRKPTPGGPVPPG